VVQSQPMEIVHETLSQKYPTQKKGQQGDSSARVPPSKHEALSSNLNTTKKSLKDQRL
jgi:hypothetical protein